MKKCLLTITSVKLAKKTSRPCIKSAKPPRHAPTVAAKRRRNCPPRQCMAGGRKPPRLQAGGAAWVDVGIGIKFCRSGAALMRPISDVGQQKDVARPTWLTYAGSARLALLGFTSGWKPSQGKPCTPSSLNLMVVTQERGNDKLMTVCSKLQWMRNVGTTNYSVFIF